MYLIDAISTLLVDGWTAGEAKRSDAARIGY
jgi:hypothetical protein